MLRPRVIPCLLLKDRRLVKTVRYRDPRYIGDPINVARIFSDKQVDELLLLDISRTPEARPIDFNLVGDIASECYMPLTYGGGIRSLQDIRDLLALGVEKVVLGTAAIETPELVTEASRTFGTQSIVVSIDAAKDSFGRYQVFGRCGTRTTMLNPVDHARCMQSAGAGELLVNSIDRDGSLKGYDLDLVGAVAGAATVPVIACGGAGSIRDFVAAVREGGASAVAAGSLFVLHGKHRAVLVTYPDHRTRQEIPGLSVHRDGHAEL